MLGWDCAGTEQWNSLMLMPKYSEKLFECDGTERLFDVMMPIKDSFIWAERFIGPFEVNERLKTNQTVQGAIRTYFWCVCVCAMVGHDLPPAKSTVKIFWIRRRNVIRRIDAKTEHKFYF